MEEKQQEAPATPAAKKNIEIRDLEGDPSKKVEFTKTFVVEYLDPDTGNRLVGNFTVKRPNLGDLSQFGVLKARYNGGQRVQPDIDWLNEMIAFCQVVLTDTPAWWDPLNSYDEELLTLVFNRARAFQDSFRKRLG